MKLSVVTPAFNESANLPALHARLVETMRAIGMEWEWVVIDDHSSDGTFDVIDQLSLRDARVRGFRLARNSGSHVAITCGLHQVSGDVTAMLAADLQDPPEILPAMLDSWRSGAQVVWAVRRAQPGRASHARFAAFYYWLMRRLSSLKDMPVRGADCFLLDRLVIDAFRRFPERNVSVLALITSLGFRQAYVEYEKQPRAMGQSGWTLARKIALVANSVASFSAFPIRLCLFAGGTLLMIAALVAVGAFFLLPTLAAGLLFVVSVFMGLTGLQLFALGVVGEYVWRALEEARRRPAYLIEAVAGTREPVKLQ